ncbi:MAG: AAA family ATPase [Sphingobacteriales bacterium]|nr:AAA family ATPase [Sphingobacteriales bacterium]
MTIFYKNYRSKNYKQYTDLQLNFKEGLVGIIGKNGTGKSTIFDAVVHCLFGKDEDEKVIYAL